MTRIGVALATLALLGACDDTQFNSSGGGGGDYEPDFVSVVALFHAHCAECHPSLSPTFDAGLLEADVEDETGKWVVAGDRDASALYVRLAGGGEIDGRTLNVMPPTGALPDEVVEAMGLWIDDGAPLLQDGGE